MVISPGDRVRVTHQINGYERGHYKGTVVAWTDSGKIKVKADSGSIAIVSSELVKKVADGQPNG
ncbi:hypothetical protein GCM10028816_19700 [Spirosoma lituiforme]